MDNAKRALEDVLNAVQQVSAEAQRLSQAQQVVAPATKRPAHDPGDGGVDALPTDGPAPAARQPRRPLTGKPPAADTVYAAEATPVMDTDSDTPTADMPPAAGTVGGS